MNTQSSSDISLKDWDNKWKAEKTMWHRNEVHVDLLKHEKLLDTGRIFLPLCGKSVDLKYLAEKGHEVVGLEFSEKACDDFFQENGLQFTKRKLVDFAFFQYEAKELKITIFQGDMFDANKSLLGSFDAIWDRGSFVAINESDRPKYAKILCNILKPTGKVLLNSFTYDSTEFGGPPHSADRETVEKVFGSTFKVTFLDSYDYLRPQLKARGITKMIASNYILTI
uniref:thiopurine S-methyltransferase n=1 Tax=Phallusia mammillata TaxID=59560 RepID=A0A6F9DUT4_9ASCI|nr:thiopurine S-methyltransferase-like [Phallusia mammillata]